jgi:hypothetical protein
MNANQLAVLRTVVLIRCRPDKDYEKKRADHDHAESPPNTTGIRKRKRNPNQSEGDAAAKAQQGKAGPVGDAR